MDRQGLPLPEKVSKLEVHLKEINRLIEEHDKAIVALRKKNRMSNIKWDKNYLIAGLTIVCTFLTLTATIHSCSYYGAEEVRAESAERQAQQVLEAEAEEALAAREALQLESAQQQAQLDLDQEIQVCDRACTALSSVVIRSSPCMCGRNGGLLVFDANLTAVTHVREVESLSIRGPSAVDPLPVSTDEVTEE